MEKYVNQYGDLEKPPVSLADVNKGDIVLTPCPLYSRSEYGHLFGIPYEYYNKVTVVRVTPKRTRGQAETNQGDIIHLAATSEIYPYTPDLDADLRAYRRKAKLLRCLVPILGLKTGSNRKTIEFCKLPVEELEELYEVIEKYKTKYETP